MITREQYLDSLEIVDKYHRQNCEEQVSDKVEEDRRMKIQELMILIADEKVDLSFCNYLEYGNTSSRIYSRLNELKKLGVVYIADIDIRNIRGLVRFGEKTVDAFVEIKKRFSIKQI